MSNFINKKNFDFKIDSNGVYKGSITALSMGASPLLETEEPKDESDRTFDTKLTNLIENYSISELIDNCLAKNIKKTTEILSENNFNSDLKKQLKDVTSETIETAQNKSLSDDLTLVAVGK